MSTTVEEIAKLEAELNRLDAIGETEFNEESQRSADENNARAEAISTRNAVSRSGTQGYKSKARALGIPGHLIPKCGANTREGDKCKQPAGAGTDHYGKGRCRYHGGTNGALTHGRYSGLFSEDLESLVNHFEADTDILNMESDIALVRTLTYKFIDGYDDWLAAVLAWHGSFQEGKYETKPTKVLELSDAYRLLETLSKMVERERKARAANAISARDLFRILNEVGRVIETYVEDKEALHNIREQMLSIRYA